MFFNSIHSMNSVLSSAQTHSEQSCTHTKCTTKSVRVIIPRDKKEPNVVPLFWTDNTDNKIYTINNIQNEWFLMDLE